MTYTYEIIQLISWPVLIYITYFISMRLMDKFEKTSKQNQQQKKNIKTS
ncbi:MAG: hypothetical protein PF590_09800 [Candidatus Delongbacteria bacterium]|jgi:membrane protein insertase Oxa1/YidC/SpoIIIJ|nr:hypothetical protein [Candidatus Delongbacteria bacterium]